MQIDVTIAEAELIERIHEIAPLKIDLSPNESDERWVELGIPDHVALIARKGLRIRVPGRVKFAAIGIPIELEIESLQMIVEPRIELGSVDGRDSAVLALDFEVEEGELKRIPPLIEEAVLRKVNKALTPENTRTLWNFPKTLTQAFPLPERLKPLDRFLVESGEARVSVSDDGLIFSVTLDAAVLRDRDDEQTIERSMEV